MRRRPGLLDRLWPWLLLLVLGMGLTLGDGLWRIDQVIYDAHLRFHHRSPPQDIVIIAIDEPSLKVLGRWPWPRSFHVQLLKRLQEAEARAIGLDIIFAEPSLTHPQVDTELAEVISSLGNVVLPVLVEQAQPAGNLIETTPIEVMHQASAALGHVHIELDPDGIARSVYLQAGLAQPRWPHFALALWQVAEPSSTRPLPGSRHPSPDRSRSGYWVRDYRILIPYDGPPGHFVRYSYADVVGGRVPLAELKNKIILVGATATGIGDALPTPVSGHAQSMPGVEINAQILHALRQGASITQAGLPARLLLICVVVLFPALVFGWFSPRINLLVTLGLFFAVLAISLILLQGMHYWLPPAVALLLLILSYPLWSWRRLEHAMGYLNEELDHLAGEQQQTVSDSPLEQVMEYVSRWLPVQKWCVSREDGQAVLGDKQFNPAFKPTDNPGWQQQGRLLFTPIEQPVANAYLVLDWEAAQAPNPEQQHLLDVLRHHYSAPAHATTQGTLELVERRIQQVQQATDALRSLRRFITEAITQMADGVIVTDTLGRIMMANARAAEVLQQADSEDLLGQSGPFALDALQLSGAMSWHQVWQRVLNERQEWRGEARNTDQRDFLVYITPLSQPYGGFIVNLADITPLKESERKRAELLGFLSHDIRSPLVSQLAVLELVKAKNQDHRIKPDLVRMQNYTEHTLALADEFLQLAHAENPQNLNFQDADLVGLCLNASEQVWDQAQQKHIAIQTDLPEEAWVRADPKLIERALVNLLTNAIKYSPDSTRIHMRLSEHGGWYVCDIEDQGSGIPEHLLADLFKRFTRLEVEGHRQQRGAGLGLAFVKTVAEQHQGDIKVRSEYRRGSTFSLILPKA